MKQLLFIRHAQGVSNAKGIMMGSSRAADKGLSVKGKQMARDKALELKGRDFIPDLMFCSELPRTQETARIIAETLNIEPYTKIMPELNERSFGIYEGKPYKATFDAFEREGENPETMETVSDFIERVLRGFETIKAIADGNVLIVTHSNPLAVIRTHLYYPDEIMHYWEHEIDDYVSGFEVTV